MNDDQKGIGIRVSPELRIRIMERVGKGKKYPKITDFVIEAIEERLEPVHKRLKWKEEIMEILHDPELRKELGLPPKP